MSPTAEINRAASVELEIDMEVKSEPETEDENISVTSSVEEVMQPELFGSDEEELEDEPLIEIESIMVPQELVKDEFKPTLLLFVNRDPKELDPKKSIFHSLDKGKNADYTSEKYKQSHTVMEMSVTKALRSVKRKQNSNPCNSSEKFIKHNPEVSKIKMDSQHLSNDSVSPSTQNKPSFINENASSTKSSKRKLSVLSKHLKLREKKINGVNCKRKSKPNASEKCNKVNAMGKKECSRKLLLSNEISKQSCSSETNEETCNLVKKSKGKENTQCNNEDENTADSALSGSQSELNEAEVNNLSESQSDRSKPPKPNSYDCMACGKQFKEKSHLATHSRAHNNIRNFKCDECGLLFKTKTNLYFHMKTHEAPFICSKCDKSFSQKKMFTRHMRVVHSGEGLYNCDICGRPFKSAQHLELHYTLHTGNKPFSCEVCGKTFVYKSTYRAHMKAHEADEQFDCEVCLAAGPQDKGELRRRCHHYSQARPWLCTVCGKGYPLKSTLKNHMKSHEVEKPFKCEECGKYFMKRQTYEIHLKTHTGEKPQYMCDQCSQPYYSYVSLKRHYVKHTSQRNFFCDTCNKAFWTKDALKVHRRSHENIKMFHCSQCSKAFAHKHTLVAHTRSHTGMHLHSCEICYKTFIHKYHLTRHVQKHNTLNLQPPIPPPPLPLAPSLYMIPPHNHMEMPTLQIL